MHYNTINCIAIQNNKLQCNAIHYITGHSYTLTPYNAMHYNTYYKTKQLITIQCMQYKGNKQLISIQYIIMQYNTADYNIIPCNKIQ